MCIVEHLSRVDADPHEVALWVLLKRTRSNTRSVRLQAVQDLAGNHHWHGEEDRQPPHSLMTFHLPIPPPASNSSVSFSNTFPVTSVTATIRNVSVSSFSYCCDSRRT